ncbi:MAG: tetratricopeptide repeat protein, partial [Acidimicrobiales bacterium]|nr:tetratricopeptide repeat protein [Acidimicrobiales bacterium]
MDGPADDPFGDAGDPAAQNQGAGREAALRHGIDGAASPAERAGAMVELAKFLLHAGDDRLEEAAAVLDEAIMVADQAGDTRTLYLARVVRARAARAVGDDDTNRSQLSAAVLLCEAINARRPLPELLMLLSNVDARSGDMAAARITLERALEQAMENGDEHQVARVRVEFGRLERKAGDVDAAQAHLELALEAIREHGPVAVRTTVEQDLAALLQSSGDYRGALE